MAIATPGAILTLGLGGSPSLMVTLGYGVGTAVETPLIGRKRPRRRRTPIPEVVKVQDIPEILEKVSEEKDYLNEVLAEANTELTVAALSTDNMQRRSEKLKAIGINIAQLEMEMAEADDEEAFLILVLQAAETMI